MLRVAVIHGGELLVTPQLTMDRPAIGGRKTTRKRLLRDLAAVVDEIRQEAKEKGIDKMPRSEIDWAVASARKARSAKIDKRPVK